MVDCAADYPRKTPLQLRGRSFLEASQYDGAEHHGKRPGTVIWAGRLA
jgi:hypothetical protein